jgi:peroxiredoxin
LQLELPDIESLGAQLVAISPNLPDKSLSTVEKNHIAFEVLSDVGNHVARDFGLVFTLSEELRPIYASFGIDIPAFNGDHTFELPMPATYVIATDSTITYAMVDPDYPKRLEPSEIVKVLKNMTIEK